MLERHGPNVEEHPWVDPSVLWNASKDTHNKGRVRGLPGVRPKHLKEHAEALGGSVFSQASQSVSQQQIQEAVAQEIRQRLQAEHEEWQRRQEQQAAAERALRECLQAVEEERQRER